MLCSAWAFSSLRIYLKFFHWKIHQAHKRRTIMQKKYEYRIQKMHITQYYIIFYKGKDWALEENTYPNSIPSIPSISYTRNIWNKHKAYIYRSVHLSTSTPCLYNHADILSNGIIKVCQLTDCGRRTVLNVMVPFVAMIVFLWRALARVCQRVLVFSLLFSAELPTTIT